MPTGINTFEGVPVGTAPTVDNTGGVSGDPIIASNLGVASSMLVTSDRPFHGGKSLAMNWAGSSTDGATRLLWSTPEAGRLVLSVYFMLDVPLTADEDVMGFRHSAGNMAILGISTANKFYVRNTLGTAMTGSTSTATVSADVLYRCDMAVEKGTTTTDGKCGYQIWTVNQTTGAETSIATWSSTAVDTNTFDISRVFIGRSSGRLQANFAYYDTVRWATMASGFMTAYVDANTPPQVELVSEDGAAIEPGRLLTLSANTSDSDGTVVSTTVVQTGGEVVTLSGTTNVKTFPAPATAAGSTLTFQATAIDDDGAETTSDIVTISVLQATEFAVRQGALSPAYIYVADPA